MNTKSQKPAPECVYRGSEGRSEKGNGETEKRGNRRNPSPVHRFSASPIHSRLIFILGGARSGKSACALKLAESIHGKRLYLATAEALDKEMAERIKRHKKERANRWTTIEEPKRVADVIRKNNPLSPPFLKGGQGGFDVILLDCLTLWISNLLHNPLPQSPHQKGEEAKEVPSPLVGEGQGEGIIKKGINSLVSICKKAKCSIIIVSNEVGLGIVPDNPLARQFRDITGYANQKIAAAADEVYFVAAGIPMRMK